MKLIQFNLNRLDKTQLEQQDIEYKDIIGYEIVREAVCSLIFKLSRQEKLLDSKQQKTIQENIDKLIFIRDHLQIHDHSSIQNIMSEIRLVEF